MTDLTHDITQNILIVDFGSQVTQLIARRVREAGVYCEVHPFNNLGDKLETLKPKGVILSGGPASVTDDMAPDIHPDIWALDVPVFGICYGQQAMCMSLGGKVEGGDHREFGRADVEILAPCPLFEGVWEVGQKYPVWMSHGDRVVDIPEGFVIKGKSPGAPFALIAHEAKKRFAVQFHPEVVHTPDGAKLISNFVHKICGCDNSWTMAAYREMAVERIREEVGDAKVICGLSGGVDSSVAAVLIHEAIGDQLTCIFVDHGLMRMNEAEEVVTLFRDHYNIPLVHVDAEDTFMGELAGKSDPEEKRKIIGRLFIETFDQEAKKNSAALSSWRKARFILT